MTEKLFFIAKVGTFEWAVMQVKLGKTVGRSDDEDDHRLFSLTVQETWWNEDILATDWVVK